LIVGIGISHKQRLKAPRIRHCEETSMVKPKVMIPAAVFLTRYANKDAVTFQLDLLRLLQVFLRLALFMACVTGIIAANLQQVPRLMTIVAEARLFISD
jgi:uncharacterized integral membrane protein